MPTRCLTASYCTRCLTSKHMLLQLSVHLMPYTEVFNQSFCTAVLYYTALPSILQMPYFLLMYCCPLNASTCALLKCLTMPCILPVQLAPLQFNRPFIGNYIRHPIPPSLQSIHMILQAKLSILLLSE